MTKNQFSEDPRDGINFPKIYYKKTEKGFYRWMGERLREKLKEKGLRKTGSRKRDLKDEDILAKLAGAITPGAKLSEIYKAENGGKVTFLLYVKLKLALGIDLLEGLSNEEINNKLEEFIQD